MYEVSIFKRHRRANLRDIAGTQDDTDILDQ